MLAKARELDTSLSAAVDLHALAKISKRTTFRYLNELRGFSEDRWERRPRDGELKQWIDAGGPPGISNPYERAREMKAKPGLANAWKLASWPEFDALMTEVVRLAQTHQGIKDLFAAYENIHGNIKTFIEPDCVVEAVRGGIPLGPRCHGRFTPSWELGMALEYGCDHYKHVYARALDADREAAREKVCAAAKEAEDVPEGTVEIGAASTGKGGTQYSHLELPPTQSQIQQHTTELAIGRAVQEQLRIEAKMDPLDLLRTKCEEHHSPPLLERPGVAKFRGALQFIDFERAHGVADPHHLAALGVAEPDLGDAEFREAALRFKAHSYGVETWHDKYVVMAPDTWEKTVVNERGAPYTLDVTKKSADALVKEVADAFRGTAPQWTALFADIARLPADVDMQYTDTDGKPRGVRIELVAALPEARRDEYRRRFAAGEFATERPDFSGRDKSEIADTLMPSFSLTGEPAKVLPGFRKDRPNKTHFLAANAAHQLAACAPAGVSPSIRFLECLEGCEKGNDSALNGHVSLMQTALQPLAGHYDKQEQQTIDQQARLGPAFFVEDNMPDDDTMSANEKQARKRTLLQAYYKAIFNNPNPLSEAQRRARANAVHQIGTARRNDQLGARQMLRDSGLHDATRLAATFTAFDLRNPLPAAPPPPGTPMPAAAPPLGGNGAAHAAAAALLAAPANNDDAPPPPKRPKRQRSYLNRILAGTVETARVIKPNPAA